MERNRLPFTSNKEERIRRLEEQLTNLRTNSSYGSNCENIARVQLQLTQLYADVGNKMMSDQMLNDASKTLQDPLCQRTKATDQMLRSIEYYKSHPGMLSIQSMPAIYRYLSLIVLLIGYVVLYALYYLYHSLFVYNDFLVGILIVFVISIGLNFVVRNQYMKKAARQ
ncbi:MAG: hypothetical protein AMDU3_IPLC00004G0100 [Thermoplasmatales archaeon I-plasma]|jgi:hypothetical protein|nr:MAG: hypothetical protein AMDU3_IPLC00004G0100 [Thermoplasmatales archaeon I-plasma]MCL5930474.1 hypothetical protein [Candidatus Thermoplasmatota archaeon]